MFTKAAIALHNFLRTTELTVYCPTGFIDAEDGAGNLIEGGRMKENQNGSGGLQPIVRAGEIGRLCALQIVNPEC